ILAAPPIMISQGAPGYDHDHADPSLTPRGTHRGDSHSDFPALSQLLHRHLPDCDRSDRPRGLARHWRPITRQTGLEHLASQACTAPGTKRVRYSPFWKLTPPEVRNPCLWTSSASKRCSVSPNAASSVRCSALASGRI